MTAQELLEMALLVGAAEEWEMTRAYLRKAVIIHNAEETKTMDLSLYDEVQGHLIAAVGEPMPPTEMIVCSICWEPGYLSDEKRPVHGNCEGVAPFVDFSPFWMESIIERGAA